MKRIELSTETCNCQALLVYAIRYAFMFLCLLVSDKVLFATSIVYVRYQGGYIVGADSLRNWQDQLPEHVCKLRTHAGMVLATTGSAGTSKPETDLRLISDEYLYNDFGNAEMRTRQLMRALKANSPFQRNLAHMAIPTAAWVFIDSTNAAEGSIDMKRNEAIVSPRQKDSVLGWNTHTQPYFFEQARLLMLGTVVPDRNTALRLVRNTLSVGAKLDPHSIAAPFSILSVGPTGLSWIERGECK